MPEVTDNQPEQRFEIHVDGSLAGFADYRLHEDLIELTHTEVDDAHDGHGLGSQLARHALDAARETGLAVRPTCPFIAEYIQRHPDYVALVREDERERFGLGS